MFYYFDLILSNIKDFIRYIVDLYYEDDENGFLYRNPRLSILYFLIFLICLIIFIYHLNKIRKNVTKAILFDRNKPRFRKRDKVLFFGRKILRKVRSSVPESIRHRDRKRQLVLRLAKKLLRIKKEDPSILKVKEPSQAFLDEDIYEPTGHDLPEELVYMIHGIRVLGFFEKPLFLKMCQKIEEFNVMKGEFLFNIGDPDDSIYIVKKGEIKVMLHEPDGTNLLLKNVHAGECIASMLSVIDTLNGYSSKFKTLSASAVQDSEILRLKIDVLKQLVNENPEMLVRVVQIIMVRLQRVTFTSLYKYLGLTTQLIKSDQLFPKRSMMNISANLLKKSSPNRYVNRAGHHRSYSNADAIDFDKLIESETEQTQKQLNELSSSPKLNRQNSSEERARNIMMMRRKKSVLGDDRTAGMTYDELIDFAVADLKIILNIDDENNILRKNIKIKEFYRDVCLASEESHDEINLIFVLSGSIGISQKLIDSNEECNLYTVYPGELIGALDVLTGEESIFTVRTKQNSKVAIISRNGISEILSKYPKAALNLAHTVIQRLSPFVRQIDFALDWNHYESGRGIFRIGEKSDCTYIVLSGRLRSVITLPSGKRQLVGEYGKGDLVGIVELITRTPRSSTVIAVRDTELAKLPDGLLETIKTKYTIVVTRLIHLLGHRLLTGNNMYAFDKPITDSGFRPTGSNFSTVALLSINDEVPLSAFAYELYHALTSIGSVELLTSDYVRKCLGPTALDRQSEYRLCHWLGVQEDKNKIVLYQCDKKYSAWTQRCIRQADCILIVGLGEQEPTVGEVEKQLQYLSVRTQKELVLLHRLDGPRPKNTVEWLNMRDWCSSHHHIRCPKRVFIKRSLIKLREYYENEFRMHPPSIFSDFSRLARFLTGKSFGLVLGGGGARGIAHIGMIKAITEAGLPIDMVGGVSIGAFMGALWCQENNLTTFIQKAQSWSNRMTSYWHQIIDLTYPSTAMFTGYAFNRSIYEVFEETQIEDLWLPYFTVTTDITSSCPRTHRHGSLWRYVRASMSLSGYLPPLCDPIDGHLLLDGGYVNNLPADIMHDVMGAETILAIDVGSQDNSDLTNYGDTLSGWWLLWKRWNPFTEPVRVPNLPEIQSRLAYVCCEKQMEEVKNSDYCWYIRPPIDGYKTLQFKSFKEIMNVGYHHGKALFSTIDFGDERSIFELFNKEKNKMKRKSIISNHESIPGGDAIDNSSSLLVHKSPRQTTFTDLAERICNIQNPLQSNAANEYEIDDITEDEAEELMDNYYSEPEIRDTDTDIENLINRKISNEV